MRAVVLEEHGGPEVLTVREVPDPEPGPEEVLVEVAATALNRADLLQRMGFYPGPPMDHEIPGMEFAGRVVGRWASGSSDVAEGDAVMGIVGGGAYAERLVTHQRQVMPVPASVSVGDAAAIPEVFITAWDALVRQGGHDHRLAGAGPRRCLGRRHGGHPDRRGGRRPDRGHRVGRQGRGLPVARRRPGRRLRRRRLRRGHPGLDRR